MEIKKEEINEEGKENELFKKELDNYDLIIAQAKELNDAFDNDNVEEDKNEQDLQMNHNNDNYNEMLKEEENKEEPIPENKPIINSNHDIHKNRLNIEKKEKEIDDNINPRGDNSIQIVNDNNINIVPQKKEEEKENIHLENKIGIRVPKQIIFDNEKIYIKYEEEDYVTKIWVLNQKNEKKKYRKHNRAKYLTRLRQNEKLKSIILNCPTIDYEKIKKKNMKEINDINNNKNIKTDKNGTNKNDVQKKRISQSAKKSKIPLQNKINSENNKIKENKNKGKENKLNIKDNKNNVKDNKNEDKNNRNMKNINKIPKAKKNPVNKSKEIKINIKEKEKKNENEKKTEKDKEKKLSILDDPKYKERQKAINNLKKFFEENDFNE